MLYSSYITDICHRMPLFTFNVVEHLQNKIISHIVYITAAIYSHSCLVLFSPLPLDSLEEVEKPSLSWRRPSGWWRRWWSECNERTRLWRSAQGRWSKRSSPLCSTSTRNSRCIYSVNPATPEQCVCFYFFHQSQHSSCFAQAESDRLKERNQLTSKLESQVKGMEKIVMENERLRRDIRKVSNGCVCLGNGSHGSVFSSEKYLKYRSRLYPSSK